MASKTVTRSIKHSICGDIMRCHVWVGCQRRWENSLFFHHSQASFHSISKAFSQGWFCSRLVMEAPSPTQLQEALTTHPHPNFLWVPLAWGYCTYFVWITSQQFIVMKGLWHNSHQFCWSQPFDQVLQIFIRRWHQFTNGNCTYLQYTVETSQSTIKRPLWDAQ